MIWAMQGVMLIVAPLGPGLLARADAPARTSLAGEAQALGLTQSTVGGPA